MVGMSKANGFTRSAEQYVQLCNPSLEINDVVGKMETLLDADASWNFLNAETGEMKFTQRYQGKINVATDLQPFPFVLTTIKISVGAKVLGGDKVALFEDSAYNQAAVPIRHRLLGSRQEELH